MTHILSAADMHLGKNTQRPWLRIIVSKTESKSNRHVISNNFLEKNFLTIIYVFSLCGYQRKRKKFNCIFLKEIFEFRE